MLVQDAGLPMHLEVVEPPGRGLVAVLQKVPSAAAAAREALLVARSEVLEKQLQLQQQQQDSQVMVSSLFPWVLTSVELVKRCHSMSLWG